MLVRITSERVYFLCCNQATPTCAEKPHKEGLYQSRFQMTLIQSLHFLLVDLVIFRMALADLEIVSILEHEFHCDGIFACQLFKVIRKVIHLAQADRFTESHHAFGREGRFGVFFEIAVRRSRNAHRVEDGVVLFIGDGLIADVVACRSVAVIDEIGDGHQLMSVDVQDRIVVFIGSQGMHNRFGAILAGNVGHFAGSLVVLHDAAHFYESEVVGDHGFSVLGVAQENMIHADFVDVVLCMKWQSEVLTKMCH